MRILHTADIHLNAEKPYTLAAIKEILEQAEKHNVDMVTIGGDMFDSEKDASILRTRIRSLFNRYTTQIVIIPGNHDKEAFQEYFDYGNNVKTLRTRPIETIDVGNISICGLPFVSKPTPEIFRELKKVTRNTKTNILLLHCTLNGCSRRGQEGNETEQSYCPVSKKFLASLGFQYILAGHIHQVPDAFRLLRLETDKFFIYPGSPASLTRKEIGPRYVILIDTTKKKIKKLELATFHYDELNLQITPGKEYSRLEELEKWLKYKSSKNCKVYICISGFGEIDEHDFANRLNSIIREFMPDWLRQNQIENNYSYMGNVLDHKIFRSFKSIFGKSDTAEKKRLEQFVIEIFSSLITEGKI
ncbi:MAG: metallophosphoesterase family protein [Candidatus Ranarchaeia archaeon]